MSNLIYTRHIVDEVLVPNSLMKWMLRWACFGIVYFLFFLTVKNDHSIMTMSLLATRIMTDGGFNMENVISKSRFKPKALHYFRQVEQTGKELIITDHGKPSVKIVPYSENPSDALKALRNTVVKYEDPTSPVGLEDWESLK